MRANRKYLVAVALLAVLAVVFGLAGTVAPMPRSVLPQSSSDSVAHFQNPPTYDSGWINISDKVGQHFTLTHSLNTTEVVVDIKGKKSLVPEGGACAWSRTYGGANNDIAYSVVQTLDGGYVLAGSTVSFGAGGSDFWLFKTDAAGNHLWNKTFGDPYSDRAWSVIQTSDGGYAMSGEGFAYFVETDESGNQRGAIRSYEGNCAYSLVETFDGGYAIAGSAGGWDFWLVKTYVETGLVMTGLTNQAIVLYRGRTDPYWNYVRVRIWTIEEPTWQYGDINQDGVVDAKDLYILSQNYGKTFSLLSLTGIIAIAGIHTYKKRKQPK